MFSCSETPVAVSSSITCPAQQVHLLCPDFGNRLATGTPAQRPPEKVLGDPQECGEFGGASGEACSFEEVSGSLTDARNLRDNEGVLQG